MFKRRKTVPDTPRASRESTPGPDDREEGHRQVETVLQLVKTVREQITALVLDNSNIRAACDDLRRQCHSQGVAFADLSRFVTILPICALTLYVRALHKKTSNPIHNKYSLNYISTFIKLIHIL